MPGGLKCPLCGENTFSCTYVGDVGGVDYYIDEYKGRCQSCGYEESKLVEGGSVMGVNWVTKCPFCGQEFYKHN